MILDLGDELAPHLPSIWERDSIGAGATPNLVSVKQICHDLSDVFCLQPTQTFSFSVKTAHTLKISEPHIITVTRKAFYDVAHAPANRSNRRTNPKEYAVWEIHPAMALHVDQ